MASVNNPPNLKPLIDSQSATQSTELTAVKASLEAKESQTQQAVNDASNATQNAITQSFIDSEAVTNAARDLVISELTQQVNTLTTAVNGIPKSPIKSIQRGSSGGTQGVYKDVAIAGVNLEKSTLNLTPLSTTGNALGFIDTAVNLKLCPCRWELIEYV